MQFYPFPIGGNLVTTSIATDASQIAWSFTDADFISGNVDVEATDGIDHKVWKFVFAARKLDVPAEFLEEPFTIYSAQTADAASWVASLFVSEDSKLLVLVDGLSLAEEDITWNVSGQMRVMQPDPAE